MNMHTARAAPGAGLQHVSASYEDVIEDGESRDEVLELQDTEDTRHAVRRCVEVVPWG